VKEIPLPFTGLLLVLTDLLVLQLNNNKLRTTEKRKSVCFNLIDFCFVKY